MTDVPKAGSAADYVGAYLSLETQEAVDGSTDPQLATIVASLAEKISASPAGTIVDIGCGNGTLLARLVEIPSFLEAVNWRYIGVEEDRYLDGLHKLARQHRIARRVEFIPLSEFYSEWPEVDYPQVVFCRNVLHELSIASTAKLLAHVTANLTKADYFVVQDLMKLPKGERHSACWVPESLKRCVERHFCSASVIPYRTRSGNAWFNLIARKTLGHAVSEADSVSITKAERQAQWQLWVQVEREREQLLQGRMELVEALDVDLQLVSLTRQLRDEGAIGLVVDNAVEKRISAEEFTKRISAFVDAASFVGVRVEDGIHFRERGEQLTRLEEFLRSSAKLCVVHSGAGTGKTTLVRRLLSTRSYGKAIIVVDGRRTKSFWAFVELVFSQLGLRFAPELLSVIRDFPMETIQEALEKFVDTCSTRTILFYDNFSSMHERDGTIADKALSRFLQMWSTKQGAKMIFASGTDFVPAALQRSASEVPVAVRAGRYGSDQTVINILDDHFDRGAAGIADYPASLLTAIDRHPLVATLAAQNLRKHGARLLAEPEFFAELRDQLKNELWNRLVDQSSRPALEAASNFRIDVPAEIMERFADKDAINNALEADLLHRTPDNRWRDLLGVLGLFRLRTIGASDDSSSVESSPEGSHAFDHTRAAEAYRSVYREDDDPKWIRESYFHVMLAGGDQAKKLSEGLGQYYYDELVASADYAFMRRRDFGLALDLFEIARKIQPLREHSEMRRASCLIRRGKRSHGEQAYAKLLERFPEARSAKTSHVDALLYVSDYAAAEATLRKYDLKPESDPWIAYEWGRAYLGLDRYRDASDLLKALVAKSGADPHFHIYFARALQWMGAFTEAERALEVAYKRFPQSVAVGTALGTTLEQNDAHDRALTILEPLFAERPDNIQAAASLARIFRIKGQHGSLAAILRAAEKHAPHQYREYLIAAKCESLLLQGRVENALDLVNSDQRKTTYAEFIFWRLNAEAAELAEVDHREKIGLAVLGLNLASELRVNALIQIARARLAKIVRNKAVSKEAIAALHAARVPGKVIHDLRIS